jgi:hypothetical protein
MTVRNLDKVFRPRRIAVVGASARLHRYTARTPTKSTHTFCGRALFVVLSNGAVEFLNQTGHTLVRRAGEHRHDWPRTEPSRVANRIADSNAVVDASTLLHRHRSMVLPMAKPLVSSSAAVSCAKENTGTTKSAYKRFLIV